MLISQEKINYLWRYAANLPLISIAPKAIIDKLVEILSTGPVPRHVAFVMDGNRRYARKYGIPVAEGHYAGFETLITLLKVCRGLGVKNVTAYAFSIENFNRSPQESETLFDLVRDQLWSMVTSDDDKSVREIGWRIRFLGDRNLLAPDLQEKMAKIEEMTRLGTAININICCPYTSRDDMTHAIAELASSSCDVPPDLSTFESKLYTFGDPVDLFVRTSGETRLSDFLCWESVGPQTDIEFVPTLWPEFNSFHFLRLVLRWGYRKAVSYSPVVQSLEQLPPPPPQISVSSKKGVKKQE